MINYIFKDNCERVDWNEVHELLKRAGLAHPPAELIEKAFKNSYSVVFIYDDKKLIGTGRALSDGAYQAAVYDIAVEPSYQGKGLGKSIMNKLYDHIKECNIILYARPGAEKFYEKLDFRRMLTGMALFKNKQSMIERGFTE